ncbi:MAG: IS1182 family transposase [Bacteroidota bacterium]|nr:IS1182 family transposase [Bacteroidota bacterium]
MGYILPQSREQLVLSNYIDDYVSSDNPVRLIDAFVEKVIKLRLDLSTGKGNSFVGRASFQISTFLKLYLYGYLNGISSSRKLEKETYRNLEVIWLLGKLHPDHKTISDFRKDNKEAIRTTVLLLRKFLKEEGYIGGKLIAYDGTKVKAYASKDMISMQQIARKLNHLEKELDKYLTQLQSNDAVEGVEDQLSGLADELNVESALLEKIAQLQEQVASLEKQKNFLEETQRDSFAPVDPEAKLMKTKEGFMPAYNVQSGVDDKHHMITQMDVTDEPTDYHCLQPNINATQEQLDLTPETALADKGYASEDQIKDIEKNNGVTCVVPFPERVPSRKQIEAGITFTYIPERDCYTCSQGQTLALVLKRKLKRNKPYSKYQGLNCKNCSLMESCTKSIKGRVIYRRIENDWLQGYFQRIKTPQFKDWIQMRKTLVEHPFGTIKYWMGQIPLLLRGKEKVQTEIDLYSTCYNLKRLSNIENMAVLLQKIETWG